MGELKPIITQGFVIPLLYTYEIYYNLLLLFIIYSWSVITKDLKKVEKPFW